MPETLAQRSLDGRLIAVVPLHQPRRIGSFAAAIAPRGARRQRAILSAAVTLFLLPCASSVAADTPPDPFQPPSVLQRAAPAGEQGQSASPRDPLSLNKTLVSENKRYAVINGQTAREGDLVAEHRVLSIAPGYVVLHAPDGEPFRLDLTPQSGFVRPATQNTHTR